LPSITDAATAWRKQLADMFVHVPLSGETAIEALRREIHRTPPAHRKEGYGARDAAIWLTVRADHVSRHEVGYLVSRNKLDFAGEDGQLHPVLAQEAGHEYPLHYVSDPAELLDLLAPAEAQFPIIGETERRAVEQLMTLERLKGEGQLRRAVFESLPQFEPDPYTVQEVLFPPGGSDDRRGDRRSSYMKTASASVEIESVGLVRGHTFADGRVLVVVQSIWCARFEIDFAFLGPGDNVNTVSPQGHVRETQRCSIQAWARRVARAVDYEWEVSSAQWIGAPDYAKDT
jgi:hypothetical protein